VVAVGVVWGDWGVGVVVWCSITTAMVANTPKIITIITIAAIFPIPARLHLNVFIV
jgi:hypothetical protein